MTPHNEDNLHSFGAYTKALQLFEGAADDLEPLSHIPLLARLAAQQIASADSIASNIEEGYGRGTTKDYAHFLTIARGSARETKGRYRRLARWLPREVVERRAHLCGEIIAILTSTICSLRAKQRRTG
jgi:four helix bundle protein